MFKKLMAVAVLLMAGLGVIVAPSQSTSTAQADTTTMANYWSFCGPKWGIAGNYNAGASSFNDPGAFQKSIALASAGIDATHGPCLQPPPFCPANAPSNTGSCYTPAFPGSRYPNRDQMFATLWVNSHYCTTNPSPKHAAEAVANGWGSCARVKTIIYDPGLWSADYNTRQTAINFWAPHKAYIEAIDMGDEFPCWPTTAVWDPNTQYWGDQWQHLLKRYEILWYNVTNNSALAGIPGYTTHFPMGYNGYNCAQKARWEALNAWSNLGYDDYNAPQSIWVASWYNANLGTPSPNMVCAIRADDGLDTDGGGPDAAFGTVNVYGGVNQGFNLNSFALEIGKHRHYGCDTMLFFNPGISVGSAPFAGTKSLNEATSPFNRSDWGTWALWHKNYTTP